MPHFISPIVGAYYRPPAATILHYIPLGTILHLDPEPDNTYDFNAIKVILVELPSFIDGARSNSGRVALEDLDNDLLSSGWSLEQLAELDELHLGYIPRTHNTQLLDLLSQPNWSATYTTLPDGKPAVRVDFDN